MPFTLSSFSLSRDISTSFKIMLIWVKKRRTWRPLPSIECIKSARLTIKSRSKEQLIFGSKVCNPSIIDYIILDVPSEKFMFLASEKLGLNGLVIVRQWIRLFACAFFTSMLVSVYCWVKLFMLWGKPAKLKKAIVLEDWDSALFNGRTTIDITDI